MIYVPLKFGFVIADVYFPVNIRIDSCRNCHKPMDVCQCHITRTKFGISRHDRIRRSLNLNLKLDVEKANRILNRPDKLYKFD
jgi:hypothetical protein